MIVDRYYYQCLNNAEKAVYKIVYAGIKEHQELIPITVKGISDEAINRVFYAVVTDNPLFYYCNHSASDIATDQRGNKAFCPQYLIKEDQVAAHNLKIQETVNKIIAELHLTEGSDYEKVVKANDYFCQNIVYDTEGTDMSDVKRVILAHTILGVFAKKKAQCDGVSMAVKVLLNAVDVPCIVVDGMAIAEDGTQYRHTWNVIKEGGEAYHVDITANMGCVFQGNPSYDWLNVNDKMIRLNHVPDKQLPACTTDRLNYFTLNDSVFSVKARACEYAREEIRKGNQSLYMRFNGQLRASSIYQELLQSIRDELMQTYTRELQIESVINTKANTLRFAIIE